jgi:hypothetical protein
VNEGANLPLILPREQTPWTSQFATLFRRAFKEQWRRRAMLITQLIQTIMISAMVSGHSESLQPVIAMVIEVGCCSFR